MILNAVYWKKFKDKSDSLRHFFTEIAPLQPYAL